jgi:hypothetical protein
MAEIRLSICIYAISIQYGRRNTEYCQRKHYTKVTLGQYYFANNIIEDGFIVRENGIIIV